MIFVENSNNATINATTMNTSNILGAASSAAVQAQAQALSGGGTESLNWAATYPAGIQSTSSADPIYVPVVPGVNDHVFARINAAAAGFTTRSPEKQQQNNQGLVASSTSVSSALPAGSQPAQQGHPVSDTVSSTLPTRVEITRIEPQTNRLIALRH